jgi:hypothetical protein
MNHKPSLLKPNKDAEFDLEEWKKELDLAIQEHDNRPNFKTLMD